MCVYFVFAELRTVRKCRKYQTSVTLDKLPANPNSCQQLRRRPDMYCCPPVCGGLERFHRRRPEPAERYICERRFTIGWCCKSKIIIPTEMPIQRLNKEDGTGAAKWIHGSMIITSLRRCTILGLSVIYFMLCTDVSGNMWLWSHAINKW